MISADHFRKALYQKLDVTHVEVEDTSGGCGQSYQILVVSEVFRGKNRLARARLINGVLADEIREVHAFSQKTFTPEEWAEIAER